MPRARPQRVGALLDDLAIELLAAEPRARRSAPPPYPETPAPDAARSPRCRPASPRSSGSAISRLISAIGRGVVVIDLPRPLAKAQPELQHIERCFGMTPLGKLVAPGRRELRPAQTLRVLGGKHLRHRAVAPFEPAADGIQFGRSSRSCTAEQPRHALDHHLAGVVLGLADQRDRALLSGIGALPWRLTHSAPARVFPAPRPPSSSQVVQSPGGDIWCRMGESPANRAQRVELIPLQKRPSTLRDPVRRRRAHECVAQALDGDSSMFRGHGVRHRCRRPAVCFPFGASAPRRRPLSSRSVLRHDRKRAGVALALGELAGRPSSDAPRSPRPAARRCATSALSVRRGCPRGGSTRTPGAVGDRRGVVAGAVG